MNKLAVEELVKKVRQRIAEGDCPTTPALTVEMLENLVDHLASPVAGGSARRCYLCGVELQGQRKQLQCEKGAPITVCEDCYDDAGE